MITRINKPDDRKLNSNQTYNIGLWVNKKTNKKSCMWKNYVWNPSTCAGECDEHVHCEIS